MPPKTKRQGRHVGDGTRKAEQIAAHERDRLRKQHPAAGQEQGHKKAKKTAARARHDEVRAIMAAARLLEQGRRNAKRPTAPAGAKPCLPPCAAPAPGAPRPRADADLHRATTSAVTSSRMPRVQR